MPTVTFTGVDSGTSRNTLKNSMAFLSRSRLILACLLLSNVCFGASSGPNSPNTESTDSTVGTVSWSFPSPDGTFASDSNRATASLTASNSTRYLRNQGFGFALPATNCVVDGILVEWQRSGTSPVDRVIDSSVRIVKGGVIGSTNRSAGIDWPLTVAEEAYASFGGATDLWGETWTCADINATNFGSVVSGSYIGGVGATLASVNHTRITVYYTGSNWRTEEICD